LEFFFEKLQNLVRINKGFLEDATFGKHLPNRKISNKPFIHRHFRYAVFSPYLRFQRVNIPEISFSALKIGLRIKNATKPVFIGVIST